MGGTTLHAGIVAQWFEMLLLLRFSSRYPEDKLLVVKGNLFGVMQPKCKTFLSLSIYISIYIYIYLSIYIHTYHIISYHIISYHIYIYTHTHIHIHLYIYYIYIQQGEISQDYFAGDPTHAR